MKRTANLPDVTAVAAVASQLPHECYREYRTSGVDWLGDVPKHWDVRRLKFVLSTPLKYGANETAELEDCTQPRYIRITDIRDDGTLRDHTFKSLPEEVAAPYLLRHDDLLLARSGATVGKTFLFNKSWGRAAHAGYLIRARFDQNKADPKFISHFTRSSEYWNWLNCTFIQATIQNVSAEKYANLLLPLPPFPEQQVIAKFLDRETAKIDALVEKKRRLIELLKEKRAALISHAVTKGVLGRDEKRPVVRAEWTRMRLGRAIKLQRGIDITGAADGDGQIPVFSSGGLSGYCDTASARSPGVIVGRKGTLGTVYYSECDYWPHDTTLWVCDFRGNLPRYVFYVLLHLQLERFDVGAANPTLNRNHVHPIVVDWPDLATQERVAAYLDDNLGKLDSLANRIGTAIERLLEYRTALISAAVTGKIDVRGEVVR